MKIIWIEQNAFLLVMPQTDFDAATHSGIHFILRQTDEI